MWDLHDTYAQNWANVGLMSGTLVHHQVNLYCYAVVQNKMPKCFKETSNFHKYKKKIVIGMRDWEFHKIPVLISLLK